MAGVMAENFRDIIGYKMEKEKIKKIIRNAKLNGNFKLKLIDFGLAYSYDNTIEINRIYLKYPKLFEETLKHEIEHLKDPSFINSVRIDIIGNLKDIFTPKKLKEIITFSLKHPKANFQSLIPVWYKQGKLHFGFDMIIFNLVLLLIIFIILKL